MKKQQSLWLTHVKKYATDNNIGYKQALIQSKDSYIKVKKTTTVKPKKTKKIHKCEFCDFETEYKSNFNRHINICLDKKTLLLELVKNRGLIRTHSVRAETSLKKEVRDESKTIYDNTFKRFNELSAILKRLESGQIKTISTKKTIAKKKIVKLELPENLIERINTGYKNNNKNKLNLSQNNIVKIIQTDDKINIIVRNIIVDKTEKIDSIDLKYDSNMDGYDASLLQDEIINEKTITVEYDTFYVY